MSESIMLFIPVYNCEKQIPRVLSKLTAEIVNQIDEIYIVDNQSQDGTIAAAEAAVKQHLINCKVTITRNNSNYSLGGSIKRAFLYALENNYSHLITLHGDDQANIQDLVPILKERKYLNFDALIGARFHPKSKLVGYSLIRRIGNRAMNVVCQFIAKRKIYDLIAGLNVFKLEIFKNLFFIDFPNNLTFDAHVLLYLLHAKAKIEFFPVTWREDDQVSNAKVIKQALTILNLFAKYYINPLKIFRSYDNIPHNPSYPSTVVYQQHKHLEQLS